jgi:NAD+ kinase
MLLPDSMELRICVPYNSRSTAWASFDGRGRVELKRLSLVPLNRFLADYLEGDHIKVTASKYPFPTVCADKASPDWFNAISRTLRWNEREKQKSFVVVEEDNVPAVKKQSDRKHAENNMKSPPRPEKSIPEQKESEEPDAEGEGEESDDEDEEEEEDYDIDEWV